MINVYVTVITTIEKSYNCAVTTLYIYDINFIIFVLYVIILTEKYCQYGIKICNYDYVYVTIISTNYCAVTWHIITVLFCALSSSTQQ